MVRRLAAIMAADVAGYSRLMGEDEAGTLAQLKTTRSELIEPAIAKHGGRVVKLMGDGLLADFGSMVEAVTCAAEIQREMKSRIGDAPENKQMLLRIGVHLGDIITDGDDIYGDGVNIAARLQTLAQPGGICISRQAFDQIDRKLGINWCALGPQQLKNIDRPVEAYAADFDSEGTAAVADGAELKVEYCRAPDGVRLAYAMVGRGPLLVKTANWMNHVVYDWESSLMRHFFLDLARDFTLFALRRAWQWNVRLGCGRRIS